MRAYDFMVIGGGIAGASAAYELAAHGRVAVLERESQAGYHATGRSAAQYIQSYGNATIRALTVGAWPFLSAPPAGFAEGPLLSPRGVLYVARPGQEAELERLRAELAAPGRELRPLDGPEARALVPVLRAEATAAALLEPAAMDIDVNALHQGYLRGLRARGGEVIVNAELRALRRGPAGWRAETPAGDFAAPIAVNAAGAWCDEVAKLAGARPVGLTPKRRTIITFDAPAGADVAAWPLVAGVAEDFYFKPDAGRLFGSAADETPSPPCDAQPDELDVATAVDRIERATELEIRRIVSKWAGLRSFVADKTTVAGFDAAAEGFFWLAGQGGYGIQTAPSMARIAAALATGAGLPGDLVALGVTEAALSPRRFH